MNGVSLHLWSNHLASVLLMVAIPLGMWALWTNHTFSKRLSLLLQLLAYACVALALQTGYAALRHLSEAADAAVGEKHLIIHEEMATDFVWLYMLGAAICLATFVLQYTRLRTYTAPQYVSLAACAIVWLVLFVVAHAGGEIRHPALR